MLNAETDSLQKKALAMAEGRSADLHMKWVLQTLTAAGLNPQAHVLDFGAGVGHLLRGLKEQGLNNLMGADLLAPPADLRVLWKQADLNNFPTQELKQKFDWVVGVEVIEHLENPRNMIRTMVEMTKPGGHILVTTPNVESLRSILSFIVRGHFVDFLDSSYPAHITPVLTLDLKRIVWECGLEIIRLEYSGRGAIPGLTKWNWQQISGSLLKGKRFSDHVLLVARKSR